MGGAAQVMADEADMVEDVAVHHDQHAAAENHRLDQRTQPVMRIGEHDPVDHEITDIGKKDKRYRQRRACNPCLALIMDDHTLRNAFRATAQMLLKVIIAVFTRVRWGKRRAFYEFLERLQRPFWRAENEMDIP